MTLLFLTGALTLGITSQNSSEMKAGLFFMMQTPGKTNSHFQAVLNLMQKRYGFPGATVAYVWIDGRKGAVATGMADRETNPPLTTESRMLAASIGKTFVGALAASPIHDAILAPDIPVSR